MVVVPEKVEDFDCLHTRGGLERGLRSLAGFFKGIFLYKLLGSLQTSAGLAPQGEFSFVWLLPSENFIFEAFGINQGGDR